MIRIYAYYNFGGFKDLYLGTLDEVVEAKYFMPLQKVYEERLKDHPDDPKIKAKLEMWASLAPMVELNSSSPDAYPQEASRSVSHSGYKIIYQHLRGDYYQICVRDIVGAHDEYNRPSPFNIMFVSDSAEDLESMDKIADYLRTNLNIFETFCHSLFENDIKINALKFNFFHFIHEVQNILSTHELSNVVYSQGKKIRLFVIPDTFRPSATLEEQKVPSCEIANMYKMNGDRFGFTDRESARPSAPKQHGVNTVHPDIVNQPLLTNQVVELQKEIEELKQRVARLEELVEKLSNKINK